jgi:hypothetical protein
MTLKKDVQIGGEIIPFRMHHLGGTAIACGTASVSVTLPAGANNAVIAARGGVIYFTVNGASAGTASPGYIPADGTGFVFTVDDLSSLHIAGEAASVAHIQFYQE